MIGYQRHGIALVQQRQRPRRLDLDVKAEQRRRPQEPVWFCASGSPPVITIRLLPPRSARHLLA